MHGLSRGGMDLAAITSDPLRGDPLSPEVQRVVDVAALLRVTAAEPDTDAGVSKAAERSNHGLPSDTTPPRSTEETSWP